MMAKNAVTWDTLIIIGIVAAVAYLFFTPSALSGITQDSDTPGRNVRFSADFDHGTMTRGYVTAVASVGAPTAITDEMDMKMSLEIVGYKTLEVGFMQSVWNSSSGTLYTESFVPYGDYDIVFRGYTRDGGAWHLEEEMRGNVLHVSNSSVSVTYGA